MSIPKAPKMPPLTRAHVERALARLADGTIDLKKAKRDIIRVARREGLERYLPKKWQQ